MRLNLPDLRDIDVPDAEYNRLLGYPPGRTAQETSAELAASVRHWFREHGDPWAHAHVIAEIGFPGGEDNGREPVFELNGVPFVSRFMRDQLRNFEAQKVVVVVVSAGARIEEEARRCWERGEPDRYYFLEMYAAAVAEQLRTVVGAHLCFWAEDRAQAVLPPYSPGYTEWGLEDQKRLFALAQRNNPHAGSLDILESGMLRPKNSLITLFPVTRKSAAVRYGRDSIPCHECSFSPCAYRRAPYRRGQSASTAATNSAEAGTAGEPSPQPAVEYSFSSKALKKWSEQHLKIETAADGTIRSRFRFTGSTCSNAGVPIQMEYHVTLGPEFRGFEILAAQCRPAPDDIGFEQTCEFLANPDFAQEVEAEKPLVGSRLDEVLQWRPASRFAGCLCTEADRNHKWLIVYQTLHYALIRAPQPVAPNV